MRNTAIRVFALITCIAVSSISGQPTGNSASPIKVLFQGGKSKWPSHTFQPIVLEDGRMLVAVNDSVYMVGAKGEELWKYQKQTLTSEPAFNAATNEVAVAMYDLLFVKLNAATGAVKWKSPSVGRGLLSSVHAYNNGFLVTVDMSGYRNAETPTLPDRLEYWGSTDKDSWNTDFPRGSEIVVNGKTIYALVRGKNVLSMAEISPPVSGDR
jgi:hypothetical protein